MINFHDDLPKTHDVYLKLWQLRGLLVRGYDVILFDEAQDANPLMLDIVLQHCRRILVGDKHQQIYAWRGAINAMDDIKTPLEGTLTRSFRFGEGIAKLANGVLAAKKERLSLEGPK